ncbi:MAG: DNA polymerase I [Gemmatimonadetes bacterium]|nr:DNA polymerase I [Gemmatimonadota bacterium]
MIEAPPKTHPRFFLIDAYALIYRAYFALVNRPLTTSRGEHTSAAWGLANFLIKIREDFGPDYLAVVFDAGTSEREVEYPEYKATREKMPEDLEVGLTRIRELIAAFSAPVLELEGYEADDVIGTLAVKAQAGGLEAVIVSGDKDFYQLVGPGIALLNPGRGGAAGVAAEWVNEATAAERLGVPPAQVADYLALIGDVSDNIPGARGIGPKTAVALLEAFGSVEEILRRVDEVESRRAREAILAHADDVRLSKRLVTIRTDVPVELELDALRVREPDRNALRRLFVELEFRTLVDYAAPTPEAVPAAAAAAGQEAADYRLVESFEEVAELARWIRAAGAVCLDTETGDPDPMRASLVGLSLAIKPGRAFYLPFGHRASAALALDGPPVEIKNLPPLGSPQLRPLVEVLEAPEIRKIGHNLKYDLIVLRRAGAELRGIWFDTMIASYVADPNRRQHDLEALALDYLDHRMTTYADVVGKGKGERPFAEVPPEAARNYSCHDVDVALRLTERFQRELDAFELTRLFHELEMPLLTVLADMEYAGIRIDTEFFAAMSRKLERELALIQEEIFKLAGGEFNISSTQQLREVLFDRLGLPVLKRTKTGPSTDASVLDELAAQGSVLPRLLIEYRQLDKLRGTYVDALPRLVHPETGRIHTSFNQTVAATGRLSSSEPNLQNIPIRTETGGEIRKGFVPGPGRVFLGADYSQIELRILAHFSDDPAFVDAFSRGIDIHRQTAAIVFGVDVDQVTTEMRARAKTINFATIYGQGEFSLARQLGISREEARRFIQQYFARFAGVRRYLDETVAQARERGFVETLSGRRRYVPELRSPNWNIRAFGERVASNTPIQGTAADLIKRAMIEVHRALQATGSGALMVLQVHDELLFEVPEHEVEQLRRIVIAKMERAMQLRVPLVVETGIGKSWYECKG